MFNPNFKKSIKALGLAAISFSLILSPSFVVNAGSTIFEGGFEVLKEQTIDIIDIKFGDFELKSGSVDIVTNNGGFGIETGGSTFVDLNGNDPGSITSPSLDYSIGDRLELTFDYLGNFSEGCLSQQNRNAIVSFGDSTFSITSNVEDPKPSFFIKSFTAIILDNPIVFSGTTKGPCGVMIANVKLVNNGPTPSNGGGSITIGNSTVSTSSSISSLLSSSTTSNSESQSSILGNSKNSGVLAFEVQKPGSSNIVSSSNTIDPSKNKILVTTETKKVIDSAKGGTFRTGGF